MESERKTILLTEGVPLLLRELIHERMGVYFDNDRMDLLMDKLRPLAEQQDCHSYMDFFYHLKYGEQNAAEWEKVMDALSVPETYFWREMAQIEYFVNVYVPKWFEKGLRPLRVWSAASATGEEAYSIAIALIEAGWGGHPIEIVGSDSSASAVARAAAPRFREKAFRSLPPHLREKYFKRVGAHWELLPDVVRRVSFQRANLLAPEQISSLARSPVIFCRNVFIYFSPHAIRQTLAMFASRMPREGHLFVGSAESLLRLTTDFELRHIDDAFVYVRA